MKPDRRVVNTTIYDDVAQTLRIWCAAQGTTTYAWLRGLILREMRKEGLLRQDGRAKRWSSTADDTA